MKITNNINDLPRDHSFGLTIGNFDGFHKGHQELVSEVRSICDAKNLELVLVTFVPHPISILKNEKGFLLNSYMERRELLENYGVKWLVEIPFTRDFSTLDPGQFLNSSILGHPNIKMIFLGYDFAFGANKKGDHQFVKDHCKDLDVEVLIQKKFKGDNGTFSSSLARSFLDKGEPEKAADILGRPFYIKGRVIKGAGRGKQIGFPTANIECDFSRKVPEIGVYATTCEYRNGLYKSITNIGHNPTFNDDKKLNVETFIYDFDEDIYGEEIKVNFLSKIRDEKKFSSVNDLIQQIKMDVEQRREFDA